MKLDWPRFLQYQYACNYNILQIEKYPRLSKIDILSSFHLKQYAMGIKIKQMKGYTQWSLIATKSYLDL